ncbi:MAG: DNA nickase, partial [Cyanobacteriota bacterium]|nr:DNA nickase [Cyanobacteriota bacterium]
ATRNHINQEEKDIFTIIRDNFSHEQQKQMATEFKTVKSQLQEQMADSISVTAN